MFLYWKRFAKWIRKDGKATDGPILEIYPDIFERRSVKQTRGELRYRLADER